MEVNKVLEERLSFPLAWPLWSSSQPTFPIEVNDDLLIKQVADVGNCDHPFDHCQFFLFKRF